MVVILLNQTFILIDGTGALARVFGDNGT